MATLKSLTEREHEILQLLSDGLQNKEIARTLAITENTVETHLRHMYAKLDVGNRTQASRRYLQGQEPSKPTTLCVVRS